MDYLKLKRQIIDYLHKYAKPEQLVEIAKLLDLPDAGRVKGHKTTRIEFLNKEV